MKFVQARYYTPGRIGRITGWTVHSMEAPEKGDTAESCANYFASPTTRKASAHYCIDSNSEVQCVKDTDTAWHAKGVNSKHIGAEHAGYARQTANDWHDPYSWATLQRSAALLQAKATEHGFPLVFLSADDLRRGNSSGVTTHAAVSEAIPGTGHYDPGTGFPMTDYLTMAKNGAHTVTPPAATTVMRLGSKGTGVAFLIDMLNILAPVRVNANGKAGGAILPVPKDRSKAEYDNHVREAVAEVQRFGAGMAKLAHQPPIKVDGVAGKDTARIIAYWVPFLLARK